MLEAVIFDWAGTIIDYGSRAPLIAFQDTFAHYGVHLEEAAIRRDMGMDKRAHIQALLAQPAVRAELQGVTADAIFATFKRRLLTILPETAQLKPGVAEVIAYLDANHIPYATTSGYDADMLARLLPLAAAQGFATKINITAEATGGVGRPAPDMNRLAMRYLNVQDPASVVIVGDTLNDIHAALAAGANAVGVVEGANLLAYSQDDWDALSEASRTSLAQQVRSAYTNAGADVIVENAADLLRLLQAATDKAVHA